MSERMLTLGEWAALPEDTGGVVDGILMEEEVSDSIHELVVTWLVALFRTWLRGRGGFVFGSDLKLAVSDLRGRKPDLSVFLPGGIAPPRRGLVRLPPDIAVEVVSPSSRDERRDRIEKMGEHAAFGSRYYWLVDPALGSLEVFELGADGRYVRALGATSGMLDAQGAQRSSWTSTSSGRKPSASAPKRPDRDKWTTSRRSLQRTKLYATTGP